MLTTAPSDVERSTFVTVLGWILICLAGFSLFGSVMQAVLVVFVLPSFPTLVENGAEDIVIPDDDPFWIVMLVFIGFMMLLQSIFLYASIALLRRRNWARIVTIVFLFLGLAWSLFFIIAAAVGFFGPIDAPTGTEEFPAGMETIFRVMGVVFLIAGAGVAVLFVWLIKRLMSLQVKREFGVVLSV